MTTFQINNLRRSNQENLILEKEYLDVLTNIECDFVLEIDGQKILSVVGWNLVEFLDQLIRWKKTDGMSTSFHYDCMDSDENLFDLNKEQDGFHFQSAWQEKGEARPLDRHEIMDLIERLKTDTIDKVSRTFKVDLTSIKEFEMK